MPIPLIPVAIVLGATGLYGLWKGASGAVDYAESNDLANSAERRHMAAVRELTERKDKLVARADRYGHQLIAARNGPVRRTREFLEQLRKRVSLGSIQVPDGASARLMSLDAFQLQFLEPLADVSAAAGAIGAGGAAGAGAVGLATLFGTASTGTALSALSGAAAHSALLAWFGGGSLAAGGLGMAGGAVVLGGVALAPVLLVGGWYLASKGEKQLSEAKEFSAKVDKACADLEIMCALLDQAYVRVEELSGVVASLVARAEEALAGLDAATFDPASAVDLARLQRLLQVTRAIGEIGRAPILGADGQLTVESATVLVKYRHIAEVAHGCA